ncbi:choline-binding protein precursor [Anaerotignum neopropionicum]|uniref:Choline-binding protein n=1 Tax=Anaerotignum neopropionicum TaxID=36847 RepID=A0A136WIY1_9FIRM|nr:glycine betaine ABC transporter substrate-binding protein [Anaerotignum neopropionicum]KXL54235.1 choline-binding protein precursor [Anaerotignum neopropionicum]KXL54360.1 choline-binding protein precursor [Anaerotignum neopropionicum]
MKKKILSLAIATTALLSMTLTGCGSKDTVVIGSKDFSENIIIGEILAQLIENKTELSVERKLNMGGTFINFEALKKGDIDVYAEYTGTGLTAQLKMGVLTDPDETYRIVSEEFDKQFDITWMEPLGFNNTYAIAVTRDVADEYSLETCSDLKGVSENLVFGGENEFFNREDGFEGFCDLYDISFKGNPKMMNVSLKYKAIGSGDMNVTDVFTTDAEIKKYDLQVLTDDQSFFPPYYAAPIVRNETLKNHPELEEVLNLLAGKISNEEMTDLNYQVNVEQTDVAQVAKDFLQNKGLLD